MTDLVSAISYPHQIHDVEGLKSILKSIQAPADQDSCGRRPGAVMAIFLESGGEPAMLFTKRASNLEEHAGQISFPGGAVEPTDSDFLSAALRETLEEVSIKPEELEVLSPLPRQTVLSHWMIHPFAAWWPSPHPLTPDPTEVDRIIIHPLSDLLLQHQRECWLIPDPEKACRYNLSGETLWGATAHIVGRLLDQLQIIN